MVLGVVGAAGVAITLAVMTRRTEPQVATSGVLAEPSETPTPTAVVRRQDLTGKLQLPATSAAADAIVTPPAGRTVEALVPTGTQVASGDPVLRVSPDPTAVQDARQAVDDATTALGLATDAEESGTTLADQAESSARTALQRATDDLDELNRSTPPPASEAVTAAKRTVEDAETALDNVLTNNDIAADSAQRAVEAAQDDVDAAADRLAELEADTTTLTAPTAGTVSFDQTMTATISGDFAIVATALPLQQLRLTSGTLTATAQIEGVNGPQTIECATITVGGAAPPQAAASDSTGIDAGAGSGADASNGFGAVRCTADGSIPPIAGLQAQLRIEIQLASDALVVPDVAITYVDSRPTVTLVDGSVVPVEVGPTDGVLRVIDGVDDGAEVLVP